MSRVVLYDAIEIQTMVLALVAQWPLYLTTPLKKKLRILSNTLGALFAIFCIQEVFHHLNDVEAITGILVILAPQAASLIKVNILNYFEPTIREIVGQLKCEEFNAFSEFNRPFSESIEKIVRQGQLLTKVFGSFVSLVVVLYTFVTFTSESGLVVVCSFDLHQWKMVMYWFQLLAIAECAIFNIGLDTMIANLLRIAALQLRILKEKITHFADDCLEDESPMAKGRLRNCVIHHVEIIRFVNNIDTTLTYLLLLQFLCTIFFLCSTAFQLAHTNTDIFDFVRPLSVLIAVTWESSMFCWFGNQIVTTSLEITDACYFSAWDKCGPSIRKSLLIITERAKRPLFITVGRISILSVGFLMMITRTSYSYFTVIQRVYKNDN